MKLREKRSCPKGITPREQAGFSLIEMIGVISIIAILLALLVPQIYSVVNDSRITSVVLSHRSMIAGAVGHYSKWSTFRKADGSPFTAADFPIEDFDRLLFEGGYIEEPFILPIGNRLSGTDGDGVMEPDQDGARLRLMDISGVSAGDPVTAGDTDASGTYRLHPTGFIPVGDGATEAEVAGADVLGSHLVEAVIPGVLLEDARELNRRIDGEDMALGVLEWGDGVGDAVTADYTGKVKWVKGTAATVTVFLYVAHR